MPGPTLAALRRYAIGRSLFGPTTLGRAIAKLGFVQADPIRAPARAQDLILRQRVSPYRAGDLEKRYAQLAIEEDFFVNYGFLPRATQALMHPRKPRQPLTAQEKNQAQSLLEFVRERGAAHPREVDAHFGHGKALNWFGGQSNVTTRLMDTLHYHGALRVARRDAGIRVYAVRESHPPASEALAGDAALDALIDVAVNQYAPLPAASLGQLVSYLMKGVPQWQPRRNAALQRAKTRLAHTTLDGVQWFWPAHENLRKHAGLADDKAGLLAPFDPVVWDRRRFELFWGWAYRFEAYTPAPKRKMGYYALPLLWRDEVVGWGNVALVGQRLTADIGLVNRHQNSRALGHALDEEMARMAVFLDADEASWQWAKG
jgi:uncharacterized protein YcaQ